MVKRCFHRPWNYAGAIATVRGNKKRTCRNALYVTSFAASVVGEVEQSKSPLEHVLHGVAVADRVAARDISRFGVIADGPAGDPALSLAELG